MMFLLIAAAAVSSSAAPSVPDAPIAVVQRMPEGKRHNFNVYDYALYGAVIAYRAGDYFSTEKTLSMRGQEAILPDALVKSKPGFAAFSIGMAAAEIGASVYLHRRGHKKLARYADIFSVGAGLATDETNYHWVLKYEKHGHW